MSQTLVHPSDELLGKYSNGWLDAADYEPIEVHLSRCPDCCSRLATLSERDGEDPLVLQLRQADSSLQMLQHGWRLGDFRLLRIIGQGGMGIVYEAIQESLGRRVALKVLPIVDVHEAEALRRFRREARAAANLHHPNIVPIYEMGETRDCQYFAMPLIQGRSLADLYTQMRDGVRALTDQRDDEQDPGRHARWIAHLGYQVATALAHAHAHGVVHRDIKPSNLLLDDQGVVWVVDFGSALFDDDDLTQPGQLIGTLRYLSPERLRGESDERCDIYALGVTLYELLVRRRLFDTTNRLQAIDRILHGIPLPPRKLDPSIPKDLESIIQRAIAKDPRRRYQRAADLADDLMRFCNREPISTQRLPQRVWQTLNHPWLSNRRYAAGLLILLIGGLGLTVYFQHLVLASRQFSQSQSANHVTARLALQLARDDPQTTVQWQEALVMSHLKDAGNLINTGASLAALPLLCKALEHEQSAAAQLRQRMRIAAILNYSPRPIGAWQHESPIRQLRVSADSTQLFVVTAAGELHCWPTGVSLTAQQRPPASEDDQSGSVSEAAARAERVDELDPLVEGEFFTAYVTSPATPSRSAAIQWLEPIRIAQRSNDGSRLAVAGSGHFVSLAEASGDDPQPLQLPTPAPATALAFSVDDRWLAIGSADGKVQLWDLAHRGCKALSEDELIAAVAAARVSPGPPEATCCHQLAVGFEVICVDEDHEAQLAVFGGNLGPRGGCLQIWDTHTGCPLTPVILQPLSVTSVQLNADAATAAYECLDGVVGEIRFAATQCPLEQLKQIAAACAAQSPPPRQLSAGWLPIDADAWRLQRIDDSIRRGELNIARRQLDALPTELRTRSPLTLVRSLLAGHDGSRPDEDTSTESPDTASRSWRADGYP